MSAETIRVILILSTPHAGSHLLSQLLGAHSACASIGELQNFKKFRERPRDDRNVVDGFATDPVFADIPDLPEWAWHGSIFEHVRAEAPEKTTLVDNSKTVRWCRRLQGFTKVEVLPVHLVRDPRALVRYWLNEYTTTRRVRHQRIRHARKAPLQAYKLFTAEPAEVYLRKWTIRNAEITRQLQRMDRTANIVSYHDLAANPASTLTDLMPKLGLAYEDTQLDYGKATHHGTQKRAYQDATARSAIEIDTRWRQDLTSEQVAAIERDPRVARYLASIGYELTENGMTRQTR